MTMNENTPTPENTTTPPVDAAEARRAAIQSDPDWFGTGPKYDQARHRALVKEMQSLGTTPAPAAPPKKAEAPSTVPDAAKYEARLAALKNDPNYWKTGPEHDALMREQAQLMAALATDEEREALANLPVEKLRERAGVELNVLPHIRENWSKEGEATLLGTLAVAGAPPEGVRALHTAYTSMYNDALGGVGNVDVAAQVENFRAIGQRHNVPSDVMERMIAAELLRLGFKS
jgi:hypothetical protein